MRVNGTVADIGSDAAELLTEYSALNEGNELVIHDNMDLSYLHDQLLREVGQTFTWEYLENGPGQWTVKIVKQRQSPLQTLGQLAAGDFRKAQVFKRHGLDYCFNGKKTLHEACVRENISEVMIRKELSSACLLPGINNVNYTSWELDFMTDFIVSNHHQYVKDSVVRIQGLGKEVVQSHSAEFSHIDGINQVFGQLAIEISENMVREEQILFPFIRFLVQVKKGKVAASSPGSVQQFVSLLETEHDTIGHYMKYIAILANNYEIPKNAGYSLKLLYEWIIAFDNDLQQHVHLENNILFPKAIELEKDYHEKFGTFKSESVKSPGFTASHRDLL